MDLDLFQLGMRVYPQPVALACGRVLRAKNPQQTVDTILRCGEVLTRYAAALALASWAAREPGEEPPLALANEFTGNLSWGHFLSAFQQVLGFQGAHPLGGLLKRGDAASAALADLLNLRNDLGHALTHLVEVRAAGILQDRKPGQRLAEALDTLAGILALPLFVVELQWLEQNRLTARTLLLMGESADPMPEDMELAQGLYHVRTPYLGTEDGALCLRPFLAWLPTPQRSNYALYFVQAMRDKDLKYVTVSHDQSQENGELRADARRILQGERVPGETVVLRDGQSLAHRWRLRRKAIESSYANPLMPVPWGSLDNETLRWYCRKLASPGQAGSVQDVIRSELLDGRDLLTPDEVRQLVLLFGTESEVRSTVGRSLIDCRARKDPDVRWDERVEPRGNVLQSLREAIEFFGRHLAVEGATLDGLSATTGTADYIATREALVNLFIHQDYTDRGTSGQVEIAPDRVTLSNPGKSLVPRKALAEGGRSQSRNPLISRALRRIGFAELAGSGLRELQRVWRKANRRPPLIESSPSSNSFVLILDWRELPVIRDEFWKRRLGVDITPEEAEVLVLAAEPRGTSPEEVASAQAIRVDDAAALLARLQLQGLVHDKGSRWFLCEHLVQLVEEAKGRGRQD